MGKNIVLIGFMGTGKSSIGFKLANKLKKEFIDMDKEIEKVTGLTVAQIFKRYGEIRFRSEEKLMAQKLSKMNDLVIATGGGVVLEKQNIEVLRDNGIIICLDASAESIYERVNRKKGTRPLLKKNATIEDIQNLLNEREPYYACADFRFDTGTKDLDYIVDEIIKTIKPIMEV